MIRYNLQQKTTINKILQVASQAAATVNGSAIDNTSSPQAEDGLLVALLNVATGSPTATSVAIKLQDAAAGDTDWTDVTGVTGSTAVNPPSGGTKIEIPFSPNACRPKRRWVTVVSFTAGTTPALPITVFEILAQAKKVPIA